MLIRVNDVVGVQMINNAVEYNMFHTMFTIANYSMSCSELDHTQNSIELC